MLVGELGEEALLERMRDLFSVPASGIALGIGDDAAVIEPPPADTEEIWTTDLLLEGIHFMKGWQTAAELGRKSLAVNLSDLASMGAAPRYVLLSLACKPEMDVDYIMDLCTGIQKLAQAEDVAVIGGDTTASGDGLIINICAGGTVPGGKAVSRKGAGLGDRICVTGYLGCAAAGLLAIKQGKGDDWASLTKAFIAPEARVAAGIAAREAGASAMTDISDGLASDLKHICTESSVGAAVHRDNILVSQDLELASAEQGWDIEELMLTGGEDYELLMTLPAAGIDEAKSAIEAAAGVPVTDIGEIVPAQEGLRILGADDSSSLFPVHGFDHFADNG